MKKHDSLFGIPTDRKQTTEALPVWLSWKLGTMKEFNNKNHQELLHLTSYCKSVWIQTTDTLPFLSTSLPRQSFYMYILTYNIYTDKLYSLPYLHVQYRFELSNNFSFLSLLSTEILTTNNSLLTNTDKSYLSSLYYPLQDHWQIILDLIKFLIIKLANHIPILED